jgi:hypothetical protein
MRNHLNVTMDRAAFAQRSCYANPSVDLAWEAVKASRSHAPAPQHESSKQRLPILLVNLQDLEAYFRNREMPHNAAVCKEAVQALLGETNARRDRDRLQVQLLEVNKALGLPRDNTDNTLRVKTALQLRAGIAPRERTADRADRPGGAGGADQVRQSAPGSKGEMKFNVTYAIYSSMGDAQSGPLSEGQFRIAAVDEKTAEELAEEEVQRTDPAYDPRVDPWIELCVEDASVYLRQDPEPSTEYPELAEWRVQVKAATDALVVSQLNDDDPGLMR